jgi:hypothetical protein
MPTGAAELKLIAFTRRPTTKSLTAARNSAMCALLRCALKAVSSANSS